MVFCRKLHGFFLFWDAKEGKRKQICAFEWRNRMGRPALTWVEKMRGKRPAIQKKLRTRLLMTLIPTALIVLALMGYATYWASSEFITVALERTLC